MNKIKIGIIGCGAVTEKGYLPAVKRRKDLEVTIVVDKERARLQTLASQYNIAEVTEEYLQVADNAEAAIIALPHHLHAPVSSELLRRGIHVLVEKPMALSLEECNTMITAARQGGAVLTVGLMRRFLRSASFVKLMLDQKLLGPIEFFDIREGFVYKWPVASDFFFKKKMAGGGVLFDTGAHTLDTVLWWFGEVASFEYYDDSYGGVEADCELHLTMHNGVRGIVELSRTRRLRNTVIIKGKKAMLEAHLHNNTVKFSPHKGGIVITGIAQDISRESAKEQALVDLLSAQLKDWAETIRTGGLPRVCGEEARQSVALIEACYAQKKSLAVPWVTAGIP